MRKDWVAHGVEGCGNKRGPEGGSGQSKTACGGARIWGAGTAGVDEEGVGCCAHGKAAVTLWEPERRV